MLELDKRIAFFSSLFEPNENIHPFLNNLSFDKSNHKKKYVTI